MASTSLSSMASALAGYVGPVQEEGHLSQDPARPLRVQDHLLPPLAVQLVDLDEPPLDHVKGAHRLRLEEKHLSPIQLQGPGFPAEGLEVLRGKARRRGGTWASSILTP